MSGQPPGGQDQAQAAFLQQYRLQQGYINNVRSNCEALQQFAALYGQGQLPLDQVGSMVNMVPVIQSQPVQQQPGNTGGALAPGSAAGTGQGLQQAGAQASSRQRSGKRKRSSARYQEAAAAAAAAAQPVESESEGAGSEEEGEGGEDVHHAPPPVDRLATALELLRRTGVPEDRASKALLETKEQCIDADAAAWAEEAQIWMACNNEFEDEREQLAEAMQVSLAEAEERKQKEAPLESRSAEEILQAFSGSPLLRALHPLCSLPGLLEGPPLRHAVLRYLQLERRCAKWYAVSRHYFKQAAAEHAEQLGGIASQDLEPGSREGAAKGVGGNGGPAAAAGEAAAGGRKPGSRCSSRQASPAAAGEGPSAAAAAPERGGYRPGRQTRSTRQQQQQQEGAGETGSQRQEDEPGPGQPGPSAPKDCPAGEPPAPSALDAAAAALLAVALCSRCDAVEAEIYAMPAGNSPCSVPALFAAAAENAVEEDPATDLVVEVLDED